MSPAQTRNRSCGGFRRSEEVPMKIAYVAIAGLLAVAPVAAAAPPRDTVCVNPHYDYQARWLSGHDIVIKQTFGHDQRELKLSTTCIDLDKPDLIRVSSSFNCVGMGDDVFISKIDGHRQACRISHVEPYVPQAHD
jgi:hypothetical protein